MLTGYGATVICHDETFSDDENRAAFESEFPGTVALAAQEPEDVVAAALDAQGRIDALFSNDAYPAIRAPVDEADPDEMRRAMEALVVGRIALWALRLPRLVADVSRRDTRYCELLDVRDRTWRDKSHLSLELASSNIQVNAIAPNYIENSTYFPPELTQNEAAMVKMLSNIPSKRLGQRKKWPS